MPLRTFKQIKARTRFKGPLISGKVLFFSVIIRLCVHCSLKMSPLSLSCSHLNTTVQILTFIRIFYLLFIFGPLYNAVLTHIPCVSFDRCSLNSNETYEERRTWPLRLVPVAVCSYPVKTKKEQLHVHGRSSCRQSGSWATDE